MLLPLLRTRAPQLLALRRLAPAAAPAAAVRAFVAAPRLLQAVADEAVPAAAVAPGAAVVHKKPRAARKPATAASGTAAKKAPRAGTKAAAAAQLRSDRAAARAQKAQDKEKAAKEKAKEKAAKAKAREQQKKEAARAKQERTKAAEQRKAARARPWERRDEAGKLIPLPSETKPVKVLPYALFVGEQAKLPEILEDPSVYITKPDGSRARSLTAIARHLSAKWKASEQLQQSYKERAQAALPEYERKLEAWQRSLTPDDVARQHLYALAQRRAGKTKRQTQTVRGSAQPKKPYTAFFLFLRQHRAQAGEMKVVDSARQAGEQWRAMSEADKAPFAKEAEELREQYVRDMAAYKRNAEAQS